MDIETEQHDLLFGVRRSVRYHNRRQMFFDRWNLSTNALTVILSSAAMGVFLSRMEIGWVASVAMLIVAIASGINLVVGTSRMARLHADLARRFIQLEKAIISHPDAAETNMLGFITERLDIEADEPPVLRCLDSLVHNEMLRSMGLDAGHFLHVSFLQRQFAHFFDLSDHTIRVKPISH